MIIPCIDLMGGKVVQLVKGETKVLELESVEQALGMFEPFPLLHVIDLDAALGRGNNSELVAQVLRSKRARVGGGVRSVERAVSLIEAEAEQVIVGTSAFVPGGINEPFLDELRQAVGQSRLIIAIDVQGGLVATKGWTDTTGLRPEELIPLLEPYCAGFLCTYVDTEGTMTGTDLDLFRRLRRTTSKTLVAAGGIASYGEVEALLELEIEVALGMSIYTGRLDLAALVRLQSSRSG